MKRNVIILLILAIHSLYPEKKNSRCNHVTERAWKCEKILEKSLSLVNSSVGFTQRQWPYKNVPPKDIIFVIPNSGYPTG